MTLLLDNNIISCSSTGTLSAIGITSLENKVETIWKIPHFHRGTETSHLDWPYHLTTSRLVFASFPPVNGVPWPQEPGRRNSHTFNCRMLKRPPDEVDSENPEARQQYEIMQCFTVSQPQSMQEEGEGTNINKKYTSFPTVWSRTLIITTSG